jgi:hypothetical protein
MGKAPPLVRRGFRLAGRRQSAGSACLCPNTLLGHACPDRRKILIVDDDANNRAILRHFLTHPRRSHDEENAPLALEMNHVEPHYTDETKSEEAKTQ